MSFDRLNDFLNRLEERKISYFIYKIRQIAILVEIFLPGEHWEVEFLEDGSLEIERYKSDRRIDDEAALLELWKLVDSGEVENPETIRNAADQIRRHRQKGGLPAPRKPGRGN